MTSTPTNATNKRMDDIADAAYRDYVNRRRIASGLDPMPAPLVEWNDDKANRIEQVMFGVAIVLFLLAMIVW